MTTTETSSRRYVTIWGWLMALAVLGVVLAAAPVPKTAVLALVFTVAGIKAALVTRNYMHLKAEHVLIYAIALVPVLLFLGLALALAPDIVFRH